MEVSKIIRNYTEYRKCIFNGNEWEASPAGPPANEIWYTSSDSKIVSPYDTSVLPEIDTNTYVDGKGVIKFTTNVTSIGKQAFYECRSLTSVTIPNSVTSIGDGAFSRCTGLTSVTIPNSVTSIGTAAFNLCRGLTSVTIPNSVTSIGEQAFAYCSGLTSITIPNSVTSIGRHAFVSCTGLTSPVYNAHVFAYMPTVYSGAYTIPVGIESIAGGAFEDCTGLTSMTIPNSVTSIGDYAFWRCTGLTSVTIPNSVTSIGESVFACSNGSYYIGSLQTITVGETKFEYDGKSQFFYITLGNNETIELKMYNISSGGSN